MLRGWSCIVLKNRESGTQVFQKGLLCFPKVPLADRHLAPVLQICAVADQPHNIVKIDDETLMAAKKFGR